jgi:hypothetical protein
MRTREEDTTSMYCNIQKKREAHNLFLRFSIFGAPNFQNEMLLLL